MYQRSRAQDQVPALRSSIHRWGDSVHPLIQHMERPSAPPAVLLGEPKKRNSVS